MIPVLSRGVVLLVISAMVALGSFNIKSPPSSIPEPKNIIEHDELIEIQFPMENGQEIDLFIDEYCEWEQTWARVIVKSPKGKIKYEYGNNLTYNYNDKKDLNWSEFDETLTPKESEFLNKLIDSNYLPHSDIERAKLVKSLERKLGKNIIDITKYFKK